MKVTNKFWVELGQEWNCSDIFHQYFEGEIGPKQVIWNVSDANKERLFSVVEYQDDSVKILYLDPTSHGVYQDTLYVLNGELHYGRVSKAIREHGDDMAIISPALEFFIYDLNENTLNKPEWKQYLEETNTEIITDETHLGMGLLVLRHKYIHTPHTYTAIAVLRKGEHPMSYCYHANEALAIKRIIDATRSYCNAIGYYG